MIKKFYIAAFTVICMVFALTARAQTDTIRLRDKRLITANLKPGLKQYMVYFQVPVRTRSLGVSLWIRDIKTAMVANEPVFITTQHWYAADTAQYRSIISVNRKSDFAPIYHTETIGTKTKAYNWYTDNVKGADTVSANLAKDFIQALKMPVYNWNLDIETFEMLPLAAGKSFAIPFYDAGTVPPEYVIYKVTGSEVLSLFGAEKIDCWKLVHEGEYKGAKFTQSFWITKKTHEFLKEEDAFGGAFRYKVKLPGNAPDIMAVFKR